MAKKAKQFQVDARVVMHTNRSVVANSMEEAIALAKGFTALDFVKPSGDHIDSDIRISGVYDPEAWD